MQGLKALVIFMGVLIIVGTTALVVLIAKKFSNLGEEEGQPAVSAEIVPEQPQISAPVKTVSKGGFGEVSEDLPAGARILAVQTGPRLLTVRVALPNGEAIYLYDLASGNRVGQVNLNIAGGN